jgi:photosystem II stability/assembly factor-like uncharacterized protein
MSKLFVSLLILVCIANLGLPQSRRLHKTGKLTKRTTSARPRKNNLDSKSIVGLGFSYVTPDRNGGVWITGTAWSLRGLIVNDRHSQTRAITIPGVWTVSEPHFVTADIGWMTDFRGLYRTLDGGNSWQKVVIADGAEVRSVYFSDVRNGWAGGWDGVIYHTTDAGQTWRKQQTSLDYQIQQIFFVDALRGWATAFICYPDLRRMAALMRTSDGGDKWEILLNVEADSPRAVTSLVFVSANEGWGIDSWQYNIVHTVDGGKTWKIQQRRMDHGWNSLSFINDREGWAIGGDGIAHTSDGGETWDYQLDYKPGEENYLEGIAFTDNKHGWAIGMNGALRTTDGGTTWRPMPADWKQTIPNFQMLLKESSAKASDTRQ